MPFLGYLKQSTAVVVEIGPLLTTAGAAATGLDLDDTDIILRKAGGASAAKNDTTDNAAEDANVDGVYDITLNTTDTNTLGKLAMYPQDAGIVPVCYWWLVLAAKEFDALNSTTVLQQVNVKQNDGTAITAASGIQEVKVASLANNAITNASINNDALTASKIHSDVTTELQSGLATAAELAKVPKSDGTATWNNTALASLQQEATDALNAYDPPTKAELDTGLDALPTAVENAAAILSAAESTPIESNIKKINDVTITGTGTNGDEFEP